MIKSCKTFSVPEIRDSSIEKGYVKIDYIDIIDNQDKEKVVDYLTECAIELHSLIKTDEPYLRTKITKNDYIPYLKQFAQERIDLIDKDFSVSPEVSEWINKQIKELKVKYFSIVHRDLRCRHLLFSESEKPTLIDWEFSNISEPAQDLAKLIYDSVVNHNMPRDIVFDKVIDHYASERKISKDDLEKKVLTFLPIIPLEHCASFVKRKPTGYEREVLKDLAFITTLYDEKE
jgi:thiamine kinase-like enzyme